MSAFIYIQLLNPGQEPKETAGISDFNMQHHEILYLHFTLCGTNRSGRAWFRSLLFDAFIADVLWKSDPSGR